MPLLREKSTMRIGNPRANNENGDGRRSGRSGKRENERIVNVGEEVVLHPCLGRRLLLEPGAISLV